MYGRYLSVHFPNSAPIIVEAPIRLMMTLETTITKTGHGFPHVVVCHQYRPFRAVDPGSYRRYSIGHTRNLVHIRQVSQDQYLS